jgi:hypothetical protein
MRTRGRPVTETQGSQAGVGRRDRCPPTQAGRPAAAGARAPRSTGHSGEWRPAQASPLAPITNVHASRPPPPRRDAWTQTGPVGTIQVLASRQLSNRRRGVDENRPRPPRQRATPTRGRPAEAGGPTARERPCLAAHLRPAATRGRKPARSGPFRSWHRGNSATRGEAWTKIGLDPHGSGPPRHAAARPKPADPPRSPARRPRGPRSPGPTRSP